MREGDTESQDQARLLSQGPSCWAGKSNPVFPGSPPQNRTEARECYGPCNRREAPLTISLYLEPQGCCLSKNVWLGVGKACVAGRQRQRCLLTALESGGRQALTWLTASWWPRIRDIHPHTLSPSLCGSLPLGLFPRGP